MWGLTRLVAIRRGSCFLAGAARPLIAAAPILGRFDGARGAKTTTGIVGVDVVPNAREVLISLYETTIKACEMYEPHGYNQAVIRLSKHRLKICQDAKDVHDLEKKMGLNIIAEELIEQAEDELGLVKQMNEVIKPWESDPEDKEFDDTYYPPFGTRPFEDEAMWQIMYYKQLPLHEQRQFDHPKHLAQLEQRWRVAAEVANVKWPKPEEVRGRAEGGSAADRRIGSPFWPIPMEEAEPPKDLIVNYSSDWIGRRSKFADKDVTGEMSGTSS
eukprot:g40752.t1